MNKKLIVGLVALILLILSGYILFEFPHAALSQEAAMNAVIAEYPALAEYQTTFLPPSFIEGKQISDGWQLAFTQKGSGVPYVLNAHCFFVDQDKKVIMTGQYIREGDAFAESINVENCAPIGEKTSRNTILPYGKVSLSMGQRATFKDISIQPIGIVEDSRCPSDVQCIQAGTIRVKVELVSGMGTSTNILTLGKAFTTEAEKVTLVSATPNKNSKTEITIGEYRLTFEVIPQTVSTPPTATAPTEKCYVGGCSAQLCTDEPNAVSTCEYSERYVCYKTATCERQASGQCGWTQTPELQSCLMNS